MTCAAAGMATRAQAAGAGAADAGCSASWPRWDAFARFHLGRRPRDRRRLGRFTHGIGGAGVWTFLRAGRERPHVRHDPAWTENNLAQGDLSAHLPAWRGRAPDGAWRVLDANAASDADLWIAYALVEAGRLWHERSYTARALLAKRVLDVETATVPGLGLTLLPGPTGFARRRPVAREPELFAAAGDPCARRARPTTSAGPRSSPAPGACCSTPHRKASPDWALYRAGTGFSPIATRMRRARTTRSACIRAGMLDRADPLAAPMLARFAPFADHIAAHGAPPEKVDTTTGVAGPNDGNGGFRRRPCRSSTRAASVRWPMPRRRVSIRSRASRPVTTRAC